MSKVGRQMLKCRVDLIRALDASTQKSKRCPICGQGSLACPDAIVIPNSHEEKVILDVIRRIREDEGGWYLGYSPSDPEMVSYSTRLEHRNDEAKRYKTKLGRFIRKQLEVPQKVLSDARIEKLGYDVFGKLCDGAHCPIKLLSGMDIVKAYKDGVGCGTCLTGDAAHKVTIFGLNPEQVQLVVYGEGEARALLWHCDGGEYMLDRLFPNYGRHVDHIARWCDHHGYYHRMDNRKTQNPHTTAQKGHVVTLKNLPPREDMLPYFDTFIYSKRVGDVVFASTQSDFCGAGIEIKCDGCEVTEKFPIAGLGGRYLDDRYGDNKKAAVGQQWRVYGSKDKKALCKACVDKHKGCAWCGTFVPPEHMPEPHGEIAQFVRDRGYENKTICPDCIPGAIRVCPACGEKNGVDYTVYTVGGLGRYIERPVQQVCMKCYSGVRRCTKCDIQLIRKDLRNVTQRRYGCKACYPHLFEVDEAAEAN